MKSSLFALALAATAAAAIDAKAAMVFEDRSAFIAATSPQAHIDFNDVALGSSYEDQELTIGNMTLRGGTFPHTGPVNLIAPAGLCIGTNSELFQTDTSPYACAFVSPFSDLVIDFNAPVTAWGADFGDLADNGVSINLTFFDDEDAVVGKHTASTDLDAQKTFLGFDLMGAAATRLIFSMMDGTINDAFGIDNVVFSTARGMGGPSNVPIPPTFLMFASAGVAAAALRSLKARKLY